MQHYRKESEKKGEDGYENRRNKDAYSLTDKIASYIPDFMGGDAAKAIQARKKKMKEKMPE